MTTALAPAPALRLDLELDRHCVVCGEREPWYVDTDNGNRVLCYDGVRKVWQGLPAGTKRITFHVAPAAHDARSSITTYVDTWHGYAIGAHYISRVLLDALYHAGFHFGARVACWVEY